MLIINPEIILILLEKLVNLFKSTLETKIAIINMVNENPAVKNIKFKVLYIISPLDAT